jgi:AraC family transcriptional regulator, activator of mtrCDE
VRNYRLDVGFAIAKRMNESTQCDALLTMPIQTDWLSNFMDLVAVRGQLEARCTFGTPWSTTYAQSAAREIPYHVVLTGRAILEDPADKSVCELTSGDIVLLPHGSAHVIHDGSGRLPMPSSTRVSGHVIASENAGTGERLDMLCGRFFVGPPHDRLIRNYLPSKLVVRASGGLAVTDEQSEVPRLNRLVELMRLESMETSLGGLAILNALSSALFALALRVASAAGQTQTGLLALASHSRVAPALSAMFSDPARQWTLPELAALCSMSRATFMRHFQSGLGHSAGDLLTDIRMSVAANELRKPTATVEAVAITVGYQSVAAFRRIFARWMGMTAANWRRQVREAEARSEEEVASS